MSESAATTLVDMTRWVSAAPRTRLSSDGAELFEASDRLGTRLDAELTQNRLDVPANRLHREVELGGDRARRRSLGQEAEDLELARRQVLSVRHHRGELAAAVAAAHLVHQVGREP